MKISGLTFALLSCVPIALAGQDTRVHVNAHAHNDYEHTRPLFDALGNGFISVEADVHLKQGRLLVSHNSPGKNARTLEQLYLQPLDSILKNDGEGIYPTATETFYLMID